MNLSNERQERQTVQRKIGNLQPSTQICTNRKPQSLEKTNQNHHLNKILTPRKHRKLPYQKYVLLTTNKNGLCHGEYQITMEMVKMSAPTLIRCLGEEKILTN